MNGVPDTHEGVYSGYGGYGYGFNAGTDTN
jgi:hypothetical protein